MPSQRISPCLWFDTQTGEADRDTRKTERVMATLLRMNNLDIATLRRAYETP